ncbi:MAG: asparagine synthetase B [Clostridia bacterium]|nr:asparagine synthetase B [Clostridia bacterium]
MRILEYRGHIRNWAALCEELGVDRLLPAKEREEAILLAAYRAWGKEMGLHLHGMFAAAIWDEETQTLFGLRDPFGAKTFYYYVTADNNLLVGTSIRKLMEQPGFVKELNEDRLQLYLTFSYPAGEDTFFKGVKKLMPGRTLTWQNGELTIDRYWKPYFTPDTTKTVEEFADELHTTLQQVMKEVKSEDETVESFLSAGVDSSYVLAMSDAVAANSCGYDDSRLDESGLASETAKILERKFNRCVVTPEDYFAIVPYVMYNMEQPLGDASAVAFALGCRSVAQHASICYSGEGADEFFGGYNMYRNAARYAPELENFYVGNTNIMKEPEKQALLKNYKEDLLPIDLTKEIYAENKELDPLSKMTDVDIQIWLDGDIYLNVDKMSEAAGLEVRMPLTDLRIYDIAARVPAALKVDETQNKLVLRAAASKVLPEEIAYRKKLGFVVPIRVWLADERYNADVRAKLFGPIAEKFFRMEELKALYDEYIGGNSDNWRKIWTIYAFLVWYDEYFVKR